MAARPVLFDTPEDTVTNTDDDSWDIATKVGATAALVAMARAAETNSAKPLIRDQFAEPLVTTEALAQLREEMLWWTDPESNGADDATMDFPNLVDYMAVRTHFFDQFLVSSAHKGIKQHVIVAAGLDSRAYRLDWPAGSVVYEIDIPPVLEYKADTLNSLGAMPTAIRRPVGVDLRNDWPAALSASGFEPTRPTAWIVEGLLQYMSAEATESLFDNIDRLSPPGSRVAIVQVDLRRPEVQQHLRQARKISAQPHESESLDPVQLWHPDNGRPNAAEWFDTHGWRTKSVGTREEAERLGRPVAPSEEPQPRYDPFFNSFTVAEPVAHR